CSSDPEGRLRVRGEAEGGCHAAGRLNFFAGQHFDRGSVAHRPHHFGYVGEGRWVPFHVVWGDEGALAVVTVEQPFGHEVAQGLAHRGTAEPELCDQLSLAGQRVARFQLTGCDHGTDVMFQLHVEGYVGPAHRKHVPLT